MVHVGGVERCRWSRHGRYSRFATAASSFPGYLLSRRHPRRRRCARLAGCDALRDRRRDRVPALCAGVETANTVRESDLPAPTDSAPLRGNANCRHHPRGRAAMARLASGHPRRRRPLLMPVIVSVLMTEAERMGYRPEGSNPCRGIRRYRRKGRERFLSDAEIRRLAATLSVHEGERPLHRRRTVMRARASRVASVYDQTRGRRAVVGGVGLPAHRIHAHAVVVRARRRRRRQINRCHVARRRDKRRSLVRAHRRVGCRDRCVYRLFDAELAKSGYRWRRHGRWSRG